MKILLMMLAIMLSGFALPVSAEMDDDTAKIIQDFRGNVTTAVETIINDDTLVVNQMLEIITRALLFLALFWQICLFIFNGFNPEKMLPFLVGIFVVGILSETYGVWTNGLYDFWDGAGLSIQEAVTGTDSRYFMTQYFTNMYNKISFVEVGLFDAFGLIFDAFIFMVLQTILLLVIRIAEMWAIWGFNFTLLIGPLFIPFMIHHKTAFLFEKWFMMMLGFCLFSFIVRIVGVLYYIFTVTFLGGDLNEAVQITSSSGNNYIGVVLHSIMGIVLLASAGKFSSALAGGVGGSASGSMKSITRGIKAIL